MPIVERERELTTLRHALASAGSPGTRPIAVVGPAGIGKSSLLAALIAERGDSLVLRASGTPLGSQVAHSVVLQLFGGLARSTPAGEPPFDGPAARLRELLVEGVAPADAATLSYGLQWAIARLAEARPVLVVVDDLQWADRTSLELLGNLVALLGDEPVAVVVGIRGDVRDLGDPVLRAIAGVSTILTPQPLSLEGVVAVVGDSGADARRIHALSGGVPFYVSELVSLASSGQELSSSRQVTESVAARLDRLGRRHRDVARAVAVLGPDAAPIAVARLAGVTEQELSAVVHALVAEGVLADSDRLEPSHPLVGEAIAQSMDAVGLAELHDRAAQVLDGLGAAAATVASHLLNGVAGRDEWRAEVLRRAGREALEAGSPEEAVAYLERALEESRDDDPRRAGLLHDAAVANLGADRRRAAAAQWRACLVRTTEIGERTRILADLGDALFGAGDYAAAEAAYAQGVEELTASGVPTTAPIFREFVARTLSAQLTLVLTPSALSREVLRETAAQDPALDTAEDARLMAAGAVGLTISGDPDGRVRELALRAYRGWMRAAPGMADDPTTYLLSGALNFTGLFPEGVELLTDAVRDAALRGRILSEATARYCRGAMHLSAGDLRLAVPDFIAAVNATGLGWSHYREAAEAMLIRCHLVFGDLEAAAAVALAPEYSSASDMLQAVQLAGKSEYWTRAGQAFRGLELARAAASLLSAGLESLGFGWRGAAFDALVALGRTEEARALAREELELAESSGDHASSVGPALLRLASATEDAGEAMALARRALGVSSPARRFERFRACELLAGFLLAEPSAAGGAAGQAEEAVELLESALDYARSQGLALAERRIRSRLASMGRVVEPSSLEWRISSLSPSEHRVASLAAQGLSNREIAGSLFVTLKTVEFHLSRCYRKLGIRARRELAALLEPADSVG